MTKPGATNTGLVFQSRETAMSNSFLASWETKLPQISVVWNGDINIDGVVLAVIVLWVIRMKL